MKYMENKYVWNLLLVYSSLFVIGCSQEDMVCAGSGSQGEENLVKATVSVHVAESTRGSITNGFFEYDSDNEASTSPMYIGLNCYAKYKTYIENGESKGSELALGDDPMGRYKNISLKLGSDSKFTNEIPIYYLSNDEYLFSAYFPFFNGTQYGVLKHDADGNILIDTSLKNAQKYTDGTWKIGSGEWGTIDVLFGKGAKGSSLNPEISFKDDSALRHVLSKVTLKYKFIYSSSADGVTEFEESLIDAMTYDGSDVVSYPIIYGLYTQGIFDIQTGEIKPVTADGTGVINEMSESGIAKKNTAKGEVECTFLAIPQTSAISFGWQVTVNNLDTHAPVWNFKTLPVDLTLESGKAYTFVVEVYPHNTKLVTGNAIADWGQGSSVSLITQ